jgi:hypothetical protein
MSRIYNKNIASLKTIVHDTSVLDAQKILLKPSNGEADERVDILEIIGNSSEEIDNRIENIENSLNGTLEPANFTTNTSGKSNETEGIAIQYSKQHFIPAGAQVRTVKLPYTGATFNLTNQYCHIQYYNSANTVIETHISNNTQNRSINTTGVSTWTFDETCIVPDYAYARVLMSGVNYAVNFGVTSKFRINVVNIGGVTFDDDECCVWTSTSASSNYLGDISVVYGVLGKNIFENVSEIKERLTALEEKTPDEYPFITNEEAAETYLSKEEAAEIYLTKEGNNNNNINTDNLAKLDENNTFTGLDTFSQCATFNGGMISNGDIVLNGTKLLLANGAAVELYTGEELPTPEGGGDSHPLPNTGSCSYNEVKEHVEYHLQDDWSHLSFTERIVMDNIYRADIDNHISYYNSNRIDKVSELQYTTANKIVLHTPYFLNGTLSVIQLQRDATAAVNCQLIASFYDKDDNLIVSKVSINSWDYSQTGSVANFFFNAFDVPYNSTKLILEFTTDGSTPINDFIPIGYIVDSTTNGDTIVSPSGVMNYRVYITQFTPSPAITGLVPDTENILLDLAYGNMGNSGTNVNVGNITLAGTSTIVSPVTVTPISESGWLFGIVKFNEATSDAYITLNGIEIYRGDSLIGTSPFPLSLLLSPGDTFEASEKTQIENLRVYGCK